jgi:hypothetical protein
VVTVHADSAAAISSPIAHQLAPNSMRKIIAAFNAASCKGDALVQYQSRARGAARQSPQASRPVGHGVTFSMWCTTDDLPWGAGAAHPETWKGLFGRTGRLGMSAAASQTAPSSRLQAEDEASCRNGSVRAIGPRAAAVRGLDQAEEPAAPAMRRRKNKTALAGAPEFNLV